MRLNYRYTIAYAIITFFVLSLGFAIVYAALSRSTVQATVGRLERLNAVVEAQLRRGGDFRHHPARTNVHIAPVAAAAVPPHGQLVQVAQEWDATLQTRAPVVRVSTYPQIGAQRYRISSHATIVQPQAAYLTGMVLVFAWTFVFLLALVVILSEVISWRILRPFNATLRSIQQFQLGQSGGMALAPSQTREFQELNQFLMRMTSQAQRDYQGLKEFSENASHELQTPIASMKARLELLMDSSLTEQQLGQLTGMHDELERLSRINHSLTLLAKLEHFDTAPDTVTDLGQLLLTTEAAFADLAELKGLTISRQLPPESVLVPFDEALAQLLLNNLLSNAIRHNQSGGEIWLELTPHYLRVRNTGAAPSAPVQELFGRFKKGNPALDSIGIGLAIVKRISELYGHQISYTYAAGWHSLQLTFGSGLA